LPTASNSNSVAPSNYSNGGSNPNSTPPFSGVTPASYAQPASGITAH
jgi:hypothetical protein